MTDTTVVLATRTELDLQAARQLGDYASLDDKDVRRAVEQIHVQQQRPLPAYLHRITALAAVIDDGGQLQSLSLDNQDQASLLPALWSVWPAGASLVDWDKHSWGLLAARAMLNRQRLPVGFPDCRQYGLVDYIAAGDQSAQAGADQEMAGLQLMTDQIDISRAASLSTLARARYQLWLRWQYCAGALTHADWQDRLQQLTQLRPGNDS